MGFAVLGSPGSRLVCAVVREVMKRLSGVRRLHFLRSHLSITRPSSWPSSFTGSLEREQSSFHHVVFTEGHSEPLYRAVR